jgi:hypothetical protein
MTRSTVALAAFLFASCFHLQSAETVPLISSNATWRFFRGTNEASLPDTTMWRSNTFIDSSFANAPAPFWFDNTGDTSTRIGGTRLTDMLNSYSCIFLRKEFVLTNAAIFGGLQLNANVDDGFAAWINGREVQRVNIGGQSGDPVATNTLAANASEPVQFVPYTLPVPLDYLVTGTNVLTVQVFNTTLASSDLDFDTELNGILVDTNPPVIVNITPPPNSTLTALTQITVQFSEPVNNLAADDLNVHGIGATGITGGNGTYTFTFPPAPYGNVPITWTTGHGITDFAVPPNPFNETAPGATWSYTLVDDLPPTVSGLFPPAGATLQMLGQIQVNFSEAVAGVDAADLLVNGQAATNVIAQPNAIYLFQFASPAAGSVSVAWAAGHGITDLAATSNAFVGSSWNYTVDPNANVGQLVINEINAANESGLRDEDGEQQDWIEIYNAGGTSVDLTGWSLSDDSDEPGRWVFPTRSLAPGAYLVVFASAKDRTNPTGTNRFHTNFKLGVDGEFLGLYAPDSPRRLVSGFSPKYPEQRNDNSYGFDAQGQLRYFGVPTPGASNGVSTIAGVVEPVHFNVQRGHFTQPFNLILSCATRGAVIRYTTNGTDPTLVNGFVYSSPISVSNTLYVRAAAFRTNLLSSLIESHSYLYNFSAALRSLPIISVQTAESNMTGRTGIIGMEGGTGPPANPWTPVTTNDYYNPTKTGIAWERPMSVEYILPLDNSGFQVTSGMRVQGSDYTRPRYTPTSKFSYRLYFRGDYGTSRLEYPIFQRGLVQNFDQIVMRAGHNDISNPFIRDELARQLHADMGQVACHGTWVNFFINGSYKGYYNPCERVEEGFLQNWHGGGESWDILTVGSAVQGGDNVAWNSMRTYINGQDVTQPAVFNEVMRRLDVVNFIDYLIVNVYGCTWDWPHNNWRAARERTANGKFRFYVWDAEGAFGEFDGRGPTSDSFTGVSSPLLNGTAEIPALYTRLRNSAEFRLLWADRVQKHFFNNGAMTDANISSRFNLMRSELAGVLNMSLNVLNNFIPQRRAPLFSQFVSYGLFASNAPVFSQHGGPVPPGYNLSMSAPYGGTIYYTTNGDDPRVMYTGAVSNSAVTYAGPVSVNQSVLIRARTLNAGNWSPISEATFSVAALGVPLRISEINYNPAGSTAYEFIELQNISGTPVDLSGMKFEGVTFTFPTPSTLAADARLVLASDFDPTAFAARYPGVTVRGYYSGSLNNGGERIVLKDAAGNIITSVDYDDEGGWPVAADGRGSSLELVDPSGDPDDPANWRASTTLGGTPGVASTPPSLGAVRLNEVLANNLSAVNHGGTFPDFVELANTGGGSADISGWSITDDGAARKFVFPPGTMIDAGSYFVVWCDDATNTTPGLHSGFSFGANGDNVYLYDANTNLVDAITFGRQLADYSIGRVAGAWTLTTPTTNAMNVAAALGNASSVSINEFLANPPAGADDWIELFNNSALPVALRGTFLSNTSAVHQITALSFLPPYGFYQLLADEGVGPNHIDLKLAATGGVIIFYDAAGIEVNRITYSAQTEGVSRGRLPDGNANIVNFPGTASPGASNYTAAYTGPVLNEVLARNVSAVTNGAGRAADYVELYNPNTTNFPVAGMSLSVNSAEAGEWVFPPGAEILAQSYLVVWCDNGSPASTNAGNYNTGQSLDGESGGAYLFNAGGQLVNSVEYGFQVENRSIGLVSGIWRLLGSTSPGGLNGSAATLGSAGALRINEWMAGDVNGPDWFELFNSTNLPVDMSGLILTDDPTLSGTNEFHVAPLSFIGGSNFVQWIADSQPDQGRNHVNFDLDLNGETIRIYQNNGSTAIDTVAFGLQRSSVAQGKISDGSANVLSLPGSATPGESNYRLIPAVVINEALTHASGEQQIELHNASIFPAIVGGWFLSDDAAALRKYRIADGTVIPAGGFLTITQSQFNTGSNAFLLDRARGGELWLSATDNGVLTGFRTRAKFGPAATDVSFGRLEAAGDIAFVAQSANTFGGTNAGPLVGPIVIHEIMYHPPEGVSGATEFIELRNTAPTFIDLYDPDRPVNTWKLSGGVEFTFPPISFPAESYLLIVDFDPNANPTLHEAFRTHYNIPPSVFVLGPYTRKLDNASDSIELFKPDEPAGAFIPYVRVDKVNYRDSFPWPSGAVDGGGWSLQRRNANAYGNDPANWLAAAPTAGGANAASVIAPPVIVQSPTSTNLLVNSDLLLNVAVTGDAPLTWQWRFNGADISGETNSSLFINYLRLDDSGTYDVLARNPGGVAFSTPAQVFIAEAPSIISAPSFMATNSGSNVTFNVVVAGSQPLTLQWKFQGVDIPGATAATLTLTNVAISNAGIYTLSVSNPYGTATAAVQFVVLVKPGFVLNPVPMTVLQGGTVRFTAIATGAPPIWYRWLRGGGPLETNDTGVLVLTNVQPPSQNIRVLATNYASGPAGVSMSPAAGVLMTVLPDADRDGMWDGWETNYFGGTNASPTLDADSDGMINRDEYIAGTDPTNALSLLKIVLNATNANTLTFVAQTNVSYTIQCRTNFSSALWSNITSITVQTFVRTVQVNTPNLPSEGERYYRVVTPMVP